MAANPTWKEVIAQVLYDSEGAMHYTEIADEVAKQQLKKDLGPNPAASVAATISQDMNSNGADSVFVRASKRGSYMLNEQSPHLKGFVKTHTHTSQTAAPTSVDTEIGGIIAAFGMYWRRDFVEWKSKPKLFGQQQLKSSRVDFGEQVGIYLLHSETGVVYVGKTAEQDLGTRLLQHTYDRLNGRWFRFSWFGMKYVNPDNGTLILPELTTATHADIISAMEAILIEGLEPPQNRRQGDFLAGIEYMQIKDSELDRKEKQKTLEDFIQSYVAQKSSS